MVDPTPPRSVRRLLATLFSDRKGATAVEYGLILALIVLGVMTALVGLGGQSEMTWGNIHAKVAAASPQ